MMTHIFHSGGKGHKIYLHVNLEPADGNGGVGGSVSDKADRQEHVQNPNELQFMQMVKKTISG